MSRVSPTSSVQLNNGVSMPMLGLGVYQIAPGQATQQSVLHALKEGYRLIDTAKYYENERDVGLALNRASIPREQVFVTTKLWNSDHGYDSTLRAFDRSLAELQLDYMDLYLIHWPVKSGGPLSWGPVGRTLGRLGVATTSLRLQTWKAMETILAGGRCRAIGVSNYTIRHLEELLGVCKIVPAVNQVEFTPFCFQRELLDFCRRHQIQLQAYSPLVRGQRFAHPVLVQLAGQYGRSAPQILIRWALQHGVAAIPKASNPDHIRENFQVSDFAISDADMQELDGLNEDLHLCWDPTREP